MSRTFKNAALFSCLFLLTAGCSIGMATSGKEPPNLGLIEIGSSRALVVAVLGGPRSSLTNPDGTRTDVFEYEIGNEPSTGRAVGHAVADILTLGLWEVIGTPIEAMQGEMMSLEVTYDTDNKVVALKSMVPPPEEANGGEYEE